MDSRGSSRRMACKSCRDRKVRCDGATPACDKCRRNGEECYYLPAYRPAKAELGHMLELLQQRLDQTEARLQKLDSQQQQSQQLRGQAVFNPEFGTTTPLSLSTGMSPFTPSETLGMPQIPLDQSNFLAAFSQNATKTFPHESPPGDFLKDLPLGNWVPTTKDESMQHPPPPPPPGHLHHHHQQPHPQHPHQQAQLSVEEADMTDGVAKAMVPPGAALPSLHELRLLNSASSRASSMVHSRASPSQAGLSPVDMTGGDPMTIPGGSAASVASTASSGPVTVPHDLKVFIADVLTIHAQIAGISAVVAEYLVWMRTAPHATTPEMLKTVEQRLREIHELAETKSWASYRNMAFAVDAQGDKMSRLRTYLGGLADETCRLMGDLETFFRDDYTVSLPVVEQRRPHTSET